MANKTELRILDYERITVFVGASLQQDCRRPGLPPEKLFTRSHGNNGTESLISKKTGT